MAFVERCAFTAMHVFPYSVRPGTPAASMPGQVPKEEKEARARRAIALGGELERRWLERQAGRRVEVLFEEEKGGLWQGHTPNYALVRAAGRTCTTARRRCPSPAQRGRSDWYAAERGRLILARRAQSW